MPFSFIFSKSSSVKCNPAVGAAADPSYFAYTVWYLSLSFSLSVMYGGKGIKPILSSISLKIPSYSKWTSLSPFSITSRISACNKPSPKSTFTPSLNFLPGLTITSQLSFSNCFNSKNSTSFSEVLPTIFPYSLAGITFVLFLTRQSPGSK